MRQGGLEDIVKDWQKILDNCQEIIKPVGAISNSIAKNIEGIMLGVERLTEPIKMLRLENERILEGSMNSIRNISNAIGEAYKNLPNVPIPETMAVDIGRIAKGLTQQMKPFVKVLREWQDLIDKGK